ncbi:MAG: HD domain-containing protein [Candidatus Krumholzibacteriota bacterium]|nr:HD domain-containing protein [Candidatus Krumholzibacteriota bacterium]
MSQSIDQIAQLQNLERKLWPPGATRQARRLQAVLRALAILVTFLMAGGLAAVAALPPHLNPIPQLFGEPSALRALAGGLSALLLALALMLIREGRHARLSFMRERFVWHRLRDTSQIFELILGVRSETDTHKLSGVALREILLLVRGDLGALIMHTSREEDLMTLHGFESRDLDHRPWISELEGLIEDLPLNEPLAVPDLMVDPHFCNAMVIRKAGFRSLVVVKHAWRDRRTGLLVIGNFEPRSYHPGHLRIMRMAAGQIGGTVHYAGELERLREQVEELKGEVDELTYVNQQKSEFASVASHELKTPLTAIKGSVDTLITCVRGGDYEVMEEFLLMVREEADRLLDMTGKILDISNLDYSNRVMDRRPVRLHRIMASCEQAVEVHLQEKDMTLTREVSEDLPAVFADPDMVRQIVINLVGNAIKFSSSGQTVTVRAEPAGEQVRLQIIDEGLGIPEDEQPHIFERFFQGSRQGDYHVASTGLGLAIVKQIVEQHNGTISVASRPGHGSTFTVLLPVARDSIGLEGTPLDLQPTGEVEEFLRLSVDWIEHGCSPMLADFFLGKDGGLPHFHSTTEDSDGETTRPFAERTYEMGTGFLSGEEDDGEPSAIAVPLKFRGEVAGAFVAWRRAPAYHQEDQLLVEGIVDRIGRVLEHAAEQADPGKALRGAMRAVRDMLQSASRRFPRKVDPGFLAWELSTRAGGGPEQGRDVRLAINFHDVAMSQIGENIEKKERPLTPEELQKLREHPRRAARLLEDIQSMEEVSRIVLHHHEWWNGQGYPEGLAGEDIPLGSRVLAIVDAFCSMIAPRRYKPQRTPLAAAEELVRFSGTQFDPQLVTHFLGLLRDKGWIEASQAEQHLRLHAQLGKERAMRTLHATVPAGAADNDNSEEDGL